MDRYFSAENLFWIGFLAAGAALLFAAVQARRVWKLPRGGESGDFVRSVRSGVPVFLKRQCMVCVPLFALALAALFGLYALDLLDSLYLPLAFLSGGVCAAAAGLFSLWLSPRAGAGTAAAVENGLHHGFNAAFTAGSAGAFFTVGLALLEATGWFYVLKYAAGYDAEQLTRTLVLFGAGAAYAALLSRLSAGVFAKAADLSADPAPGAKEKTWEPRRDPGAVADCVGDHAAGAALSADLYGAFSVSLLTAMWAGAAAYANDGMSWNAMLFPLIVAAVGTVCSLIAALLVKAGENSGERSLLCLLGKGALAGAGLTAAVSAPASYLLTGSWRPWCAVLVGLAAALAAAFVTVRTCSGLGSPTRRLASAAENSVSAQLSAGAALGLRSSAGLTLLLLAALAGAFLCGGGQLDPAYASLYGHALVRGLYGVSLAGVGLTSGLGFALAASLFSPIAGCAARAADAGKAMSERAAVLDLVGGSAAAVGRSLSACATVFAAPVLLWAYAEAANRTAALDFSLTDLALLCGALLGAAAVYLFASLLFSGVQSCLQPMAAELRRQNRGLRHDKADPDFAACVDLCARSAAIRTLAPGLFIAAPVLAGLLLGPEGMAGFLWAGALLGITAALGLGLSGGALDSARRRVESGRRGGAEARRSALTGGRMGGVCKDVLGPSLVLLARLFLTLSPLLLPLVSRCGFVSLLG